MTHATRKTAGEIRTLSRWDKRKAESGERLAQEAGRSRRASVLVVVLVVLVVLALGAYTFSEYMIVESQATLAFAHEAQARAAADSGLEVVCSLLAQRATLSPQLLYDNPGYFQGVVVRSSNNPREAARFSVIMSIENDASGHAVRYGVLDESSKLNINILPKLITNATQAQTALLALPDMTPDLADAILDFIDSDTNVRQYGAEDETYGALGYKAKNGPLDSLDEMLLIRGVTPWLLFGEDANRNGVLDPNENDGELSPPMDNADGILSRGWSVYLTVHSRETNLMYDGTPKINVNQTSMQDLYEQIQAVLGDEMALFVMAYRAQAPATSGGGATAGGNATASTGTSGSGTSGASGSSGSGSGSATASSSKSSSGSSSSGSSSSKSSGSKSTGVGTTQSASTQVGTTSGASGASTKLGTTSGAATAKSGLATTTTTQSSTKATSGTSGTQTTSGTSTTQTLGATGAAAPIIVAGLDVTAGAQTTINSLYDLLDQTLNVTIFDQPTTLYSPWTSEAGSIQAKLPEMFDTLTVSTSEFIDGRVNINQARPEVLAAIFAALPDVPTSAIDAIVGGQAAPAASSAADRLTTGWLLGTGAVDLPTMRKLDKYLTARGDVYRVQSVGYFEKGGVTARIEAVIDATKSPPAVIFQRDLSDMGRGFPSQFLQTGSSASQ